MVPSDGDNPERTPRREEAGACDDRRESVYRTNLEAFGARAAHLCQLLRRGRLTGDACFLALTQLWIQLARSHRSLDDKLPDGKPGGGHERGPF